MYVNPTYSRLVLSILSTILLVLTACTPWQDPTVDIPERNKSALNDLQQVDQQLESIGALKTREQLDSLLVWTVLLKNFAEDAALAYAREATRIATDKNYLEDQAVGRYYMALLEGRQQVFREGLADPLVNAWISKELWEKTENEYWLASISHLIGDLYYRQELPDSAKYYFSRTLDLERSWISDTLKTLSLTGSALQGLGLLEADAENYEVAQKYFDQASIRYQKTGDAKSAGILLQEYSYLAYYRDDLNEAIRIADSAVAQARKLNDNYNLEHSLQLSGEMLVRLYRSTRDTNVFNLAKQRFINSLAIQGGNYFYSYRELGGLMQSRANRDPERPDFVDSALVYYQLSLEEARREGALDYFRAVSKNISRLCEWLQRSKGRDCEEILGATASNYLFLNYSGVVDTITSNLTEANSSFSSFERQQLQLNSKRRIRNFWIAAGIITLFGLLVALLIFQRQERRRLQARMDALRAQINPHFFSNSLNAIESLVNLDQRKAASKYLIHFSRLTRRVLNSSMESSTSLAGELETTKHFLALEQLRFKDKLHYEMSIDDTLDPSLIEVPALIFQPYLENAIWHGIKPKEGLSLLQIKVSKEGKSLQCVIQDDGIGREAAEQLRENTVLQKKSVGMKITQERLESFGGGTVEIIDLYQDNGIPAGTKVVLNLPYKIFKHE